VGEADLLSGLRAMAHLVVDHTGSNARHRAPFDGGQTRNATIATGLAEFACRPLPRGDIHRRRPL